MAIAAKISGERFARIPKLRDSSFVTSLLSVKMALYLDSAIVSQAQEAFGWGWVKGITTNPALLAQNEEPSAIILETLRTLCSGEIYYQLMSSTISNMLDEARKAQMILGKQLVLKVPATPIGFDAVARLSPDMTCSVTGIYHPCQALVAQEAGAKYAIAYVNRATKLLGDGIGLVAAMARVLDSDRTKILAASLKSPDEAVAAVNAGAHHLTLPLDLLRDLAHHPLSDQTVKDFNQSGKGLCP